MAKQKPAHAPLGGMTVMVFKLEGDDATLQAGLKLVSDAIARTMPTSSLPSQRRQLAAAASNGAATASPVTEDELHDDAEAGTAANDEDVLDVTAASPANSSPRAKRKPPVMSFVNDLNLRPADKQSLKEFDAEKKPASQVEKITLCVYYLCRVLELKGVTANHVYTCLKHINYKTPNDLPMTMRTIAKRKGYIDASNGDDLKITNPGDNFIEHELPRGGESK